MLPFMHASIHSFIHSCAVIGIELRVSWLLVKHFAAKLYPQPHGYCLYFIFKKLFDYLLIYFVCREGGLNRVCGDQKTMGRNPLPQCGSQRSNSDC